MLIKGIKDLINYSGYKYTQAPTPAKDQPLLNSKHAQLYTTSPLNDVQVDSTIVDRCSFHYTASERNPSYSTGEISNPYYPA